MSIWNKKILSILSAENHLIQEDAELPLNNTKLKLCFQSKDFISTYNALGGRHTPESIQLPRSHFWVGDHYLFIDDALCFNRYRLATLRSSTYNNTKLDINSYRRYCRQFEIECIKAGIREGYWSNQISEEHFGQPADAGDFFGNGSPGWKYRAFQDYMVDIYMSMSKLSLVRLPIYANLMVGRKLERLDKLLLKGDQQSNKYVGQHLTRLLTE